MDREILFRGKRRDNGKWVEGCYVRTVTGQAYILPKATFISFDDGIAIGGFVEVAPSTVGQYTGLTDKNDVKIFDGDIVWAGYYKWKCQVVWDEKCARFICYTIEGERRIVYVDMVEKDGKSALDVIGNVHDNPELIGGDG